MCTAIQNLEINQQAMIVTSEHHCCWRTLALVWYRLSSLISSVDIMSDVALTWCLMNIWASHSCTDCKGGGSDDSSLRGNFIGLGFLLATRIAITWKGRPRTGNVSADCRDIFNVGFHWFFHVGTELEYLAWCSKCSRWHHVCVALNDTIVAGLQVMKDGLERRGS